MTRAYFNSLLQRKEDILAGLDGQDLNKLTFRAGYVQALKDISETSFEDVT